MDFVERLPKSQGLDTLTIVVDRLSKYSHFIPLSHTFSAKQVVEIFIREVIRLHGFPRSIISDRDKIFVSSFWTELFALQGTTLMRSSVFHPQTDGQTERVNRCVETYLCCFCNEQPKQWFKWIPWVEYWYNTTFHISINATPYSVLYGQPPPPLVSYGDRKTSNHTLEQQLR